MRVLAALALAGLALAALLLAGCNGTGDGTQPTSQTSATGPVPTGGPVALTERFNTTGLLPETWKSDHGTWRIESPSAPSVLYGQGGGPGRSSLIAPAGTHQDFEATVRFLMVSGDHPQGGGLSFRYQDPGHYRIIRYSASEQDWHYFTVEGGEAAKQGIGTLVQQESHPQIGAWVELRVRVQGNHVEAWSGPTKVIDFTDPAPPAPGGIGPFVRGNGIVLFDDLTIQPL